MEWEWKAPAKAGASVFAADGVPLPGGGVTMGALFALEVSLMTHVFALILPQAVFAAASVFAAAPCVCFPIFGLFGLALTAFWIWMIIDAATKEPAEEPNKIMWVLIVVLLHWLGAAIYYFARRPERIRKYGR